MTMILIPRRLTVLLAFAMPLMMASPTPPSFLPDLIKRVATDAEVDFSDFDTLRNNEGLGNQIIHFYPPEYKNALQNGDYDTISRLNDLTTRDLNPIIANINQAGEGAWWKFVDDRTKISYWLSFTGHPARPDAYMWTFVLPASQVDGDGSRDDLNTNVVQVGCMSTNSKFLGITLHTYKTTSQRVAAIGSDIAKKAVTEFVQARIAGAQVAVAISTAAEGAAAGVAEIAAEKLTLVEIATSLLTIGIVVVVTALMVYIHDFVGKECKGSTTIYNWSDTEEYELVAEYGHNEVASDSIAFNKAFLGAVPNSVFLPSGFTALSTPQASIGNYGFIKGGPPLATEFGVALEVRNLRNKADGFRVKYYINSALENLMGIAPLNPGVSLKDYYIDDDKWSQGGTQEKQIRIGKGVPVLAHSPKLRGSLNEIYTFNVHIGLRSETVFNHSVAEHPTNVTQPAPQIPAAVEVGEGITLSNGSVAIARVAAQASVSKVANPTLMLPQGWPAQSVTVA